MDTLTPIVIDNDTHRDTYGSVDKFCALNLKLSTILD